MPTFTPRIATAAMLVTLWLAPALAHAQLGNLLNQGGSSGGSSGGSQGLGGLGSQLGGSLSGAGGALTGQSMSSGSMGNVAGLLQFCIKNNYLSPASASGVQSSLLGKLPGGAQTTDSGYASGSSGILTGGNGSQLDLSGGGLKAQATKQICNKVLSQGKSML